MIFFTNFLKNKLCEKLDISGINVLFSSPETIVTLSRLESLFYIIENSEIKIGYIPKIKIIKKINEIYLFTRYQKLIFIYEIVKNVSGKAYLNAICTLNKEVEIQVSTLRLK